MGGLIVQQIHFLTSLLRILRMELKLDLIRTRCPESGNQDTTDNSFIMKTSIVRMAKTLRGLDLSYPYLKQYTIVPSLALATPQCEKHINYSFMT